MNTFYNNFNMIQKEKIKKFLGGEYPKHDICVAPYAWGNKPNDLELRIIQSSFKPKEEGRMCISFRFYGETEEDSMSRKCEEVTIEHKYRIGSRNVYQLFDNVLSGYTFLTAYTESGSRNNDWLKSSIIGIDIDNGLTIKEALERCEYYGLIPTFVYPTYSHNESFDESGKQIEKYRLIFITSEIIIDPKIHKLLIGMLMDIFPECDENCSNICRLFHGTNKNWAIIWGDLEHLSERVTDIRDIVLAFWKKNTSQNTQVKNFYRSFGVDSYSNQEPIKLLSHSEGIEVLWIARQEKNIKKVSKEKCEVIEWNNEASVFQKPDSLASKLTIMQEINIETITRSCYLFKQARKGMYWLYEKEIVHLTTNLFDVRGASEELRKIILNSPEWYNNDSYTQEDYINKINSVPYRFKYRTSCNKICRFWGTEFCNCKKKNILDNLSKVINRITCNENVPSYDVVEAERQLHVLRNQIITTDTFSIDSHIQVFPIEASIGKTQTLIKAVIDLPSEIRVLVVTKLKEEQYRLYRAIYEVLGDQVIMYNADSVMEHRQILNSKIVIITHEKYRKLCGDRKEADIFTYNRQLLLIDEQVDLLTYFKLNVNILNDLGIILEGTEVWKTYTELVAPLKQEIDSQFTENTKNQWIKEPFQCLNVEEKVSQICSYLAHSHFSSDSFKGTQIKDKDELMKQIEEIKYYFNTPYLLIDKQGIHSANLNIKHLEGFNRIIILDANASFVEIYKSSMFKVHEFGKVINHFNTTLFHIKHNTTKTKKNRTLDYLIPIQEYIQCNTSEDDEFVIFGSANESDPNNSVLIHDGLEVVTFAGSRGKNTWAHCNKAFVIHTQALSPINYVFQYIYYFPSEAEEMLGNNDSIQFGKGSLKTWEFVNNQRLQSIYATDIAGNMYQAVKRIDRNLEARKEHVELHIMTVNQQVVDIVIAQLKGLREVRESILVEAKKKEKKVQISDAKTIQHKIEELPSGVYTKKELREYCGIPNREKFARGVKILEDELGITLADLGVVKETHRAYEVNK